LLQPTEIVTAANIGLLSAEKSEAAERFGAFNQSDLGILIKQHKLCSSKKLSAMTSI
jgi:hypothetical protein